jgi:ATP-dependent Lhr-like helicase
MTMNSAVSASEPASAAFARLHPGVQRWLWTQGWPSLRDIQEQAAHALLDGSNDLIIAAPTASGKTEAAWLPICSQLATADDDVTADRRPASTGIQALYVAPLKALINDQHTRLQDLCDTLHLPVHRWHGDVPGTAKRNLLRNASGLLLITPESLEALFVNRGTEVPAVFAGLSHVVIDELHSFIGAERGAQLQSLLHRVELAVRRRVPRVALSATVGDFSVAREFLRPGNAATVTVLQDTGDGGELKLQLRGYLHTLPEPGAQPPGNEDGNGEESSVATGGLAAIANDLYRVLRGQDNLVFANSRGRVEALTDRLGRRSEIERVPNEFVAHHGNLSREIREDAEARLKDSARPTTAICTSTLEMGIDIGSVDSIAQVGAPTAVAGLRQRLGRSGRRAGQPKTMRVYVSELAVDREMPLEVQLRAELVQTVAMIDLLLAGWYESPNGAALHLSTLIQQILSVIAQHGGVRPAQAYSALCGDGPFRQVDRSTFANLLRTMGESQLIVQESSGLLLHGPVGERLVNHYSFYAAFSSTEEYRLIADGRPIGMLPVDKLLSEGSMLIFAGRRWRVLGIDTSRKVITLTRAGGGRAPSFTSDGPTVDDRVRQQMHHVLASTDVPIYLDATARTLLAQARAAFAEYDLDRHAVFGTEKQSVVLPWCGDVVMDTLALVFTRYGLKATAEGLSVTVAANPKQTLSAIRALAAQQPPAAIELAALVKFKERDKHDRYLDEPLLTESFAAASVNVAGAWQALQELAAGAEPVVLLGSLPDIDDGEPYAMPTEADETTLAALDGCDFAVIDVETTGLAPHRSDRIIEIAVTQVARDGTPGTTWSTLVNPGRDPGPTSIHGLTHADLADAPVFADIAGDVAARIAGRVIVAHNALFDLAFLHAEFARSGHPLPPWPALCTLEVSYVLRPDGPRKLAACAAAEGLEVDGAHTAGGDALMTGLLLGKYLSDAASSGLGLAALGTRPLIAPPTWAAPSPSGRRKDREETGSGNSTVGRAVRGEVARVGSAADDAYLDALDRALSRNNLSDSDVDGLHDLAGLYGLTSSRVHELTQLYVAALAASDSSIDTAAVLQRLTP